MRSLEERPTRSAIEDTRKKVLSAFRKIRRRGVRARANFLCCTNCATSGLNVKGKRGGVYWHAQNEESFRRDGELVIGFFTETGKGSVDVARDLVKLLKAEGLEVEWNGTGDQKITVKTPRKLRDVDPPEGCVKPTVKLVGEDGNAFGILGKVRKALKRAGYPKADIEEYQKEATSGNYDNLLAVTQKWVNVE